VEELMSAVQQHEAMQPALTEDSDSEEGVELMEVHEIREQSIKRTKKPTMRLLGWIGKQHALILVDSGYAATFISTNLVEKCELSAQHSEHSQYTADGGLMTCDPIVPRL
jgi:hypothetical protein